MRTVAGYLQMTLWQLSHSGHEAAPRGQGLVLSTAALGDAVLGDPACTSTGRDASASREPSYPTTAEGRAVLSAGLGRETGIFTTQIIPLWMG